MSDGISIAELRGRRDQEFDGEAHLATAELDALVAAAEAVRTTLADLLYRDPGSPLLTVTRETLGLLETAVAPFDFGER